MNRIFVTLSLVFLAATSSFAAEPKRPNIIFILSDDLAQGDIGCYGQKLIHTPNLDRMALEGTRFTQAYCGTTVCAPSRTSAHSYFPTYLYRDSDKFDLPGNTGKGIGTTYAQELIHRDAEQWLRDHHSNPFFLFYAITLPHGTHEIDNLGQYAATDWTPTQKAYAAQVTRLDSDVGKIIALLKELKVEENTLVMLSGDNGSSFDRESDVGKRFDQSMGGKLRGFKRSMYEGGLRQAALARWPGIVPAGRVCDEPWAFWDFLPTATELASAPLPNGFRTDGLSLVSMLKGGTAPKRDYFYWELHEGSFIQAVRFGDWKAVRNGPNKPIELYNLASDVGESANVASQHSEWVAKAESLLTAAHRDDPNWPVFENQKQRNEWRKEQPAAAK